MKASYGPPAAMTSPMPPPPPLRADVIDSPSAYPLPYYLPSYAPPPPLAGPLPHPDPEQQRISTLFVSGLPDDVKPREIHNLFHRRSGFDSCLLEYTGRGNQAVAFVIFFTHHAAMAAMNALNGVLFDPETGATLHIELARSNSRERQRGRGAYRVIDKRPKVKDDNDRDPWSDAGDESDEPSGTENDNSGDKRALASEQEQSDDTRSKHDKMQAASKELSEKSLSVDIPPCSTVFIANLGPTCTEEELKEILSKYPGFNVLKMRGRGGMPVAFADFMDVESSTAAMDGLQGTLLSSSDRGGMHLEYARSKMRKS